MLQVSATALEGVLLLAPQVHADARGFFVESFNARAFQQATGLAPAFVQDNHSHSTRGVLRGLHYQLGPPQAKLVRVAQGRVFDVVVDLRRGSPTLGRWSGCELSADNQRQLWIPPGFAHGFLVLSDRADVLYKATAYYEPRHERTLAWDDPQVGIAWPLEQLQGAPLLSARDAAAPGWAQVEPLESRPTA